MTAPTNDPIVAEVRAARDRHAAQFGYELKAIFRDIQSQQKSSGQNFVRYPSRPAAESSATAPSR